MDERSNSGVYRHHTILTATREGTETFKTVDEMPAVLRATCLKVLDGRDTATLIIADQRGLDAWRAAQEQARLAEEAPPAKQEQRAGWRFRLSLPARIKIPERVSWRLVAELLFCGAAGLAIWLLALR